MDPLTHAFGDLAGEAFELPSGFVNHATMGAEALTALGLEDGVAEWTARNHVPMRAPVATGRPIDPVEWRQELGDYDRVGDWVQFFDHRLTREGWRGVVAEVVPVLLPGLGTHLFHGLIRTAHAVRAVRHRSAPQRLDELARGLGYWAARYGTGRGTVGVGPPLRPAARPEPGGDDPAGARPILDLASVAARSYLDRPGIVPLHGVTAPAAYLMMAADLPADAHETALHAFRRTHAQLFPARGEQRALPDDDPAGVDPRALSRARDAHPIKLVEACLRLADATGDAAFVACARTMTG